MWSADATEVAIAAKETAGAINDWGAVEERSARTTEHVEDENRGNKAF